MNAKRTSWILIPILCSCASVHPGRHITFERPAPFDVSTERDGHSNKDGYALLYLTFENTSSKWVGIEGVDLFPGHSKTAFRTIEGDDLKDWAIANAQREELEAYNAAVVATIIGAAGGVAIAAAGDSTSGGAIAAQGLGAMAVTGALGYAAADALSSGLNAHQRPGKLPENHVNRAFRLPGGMFVRKWTLIEKPAGEPLTLIRVEVKMKDGSRHRGWVNLDPYERGPTPIPKAPVNVSAPDQTPEEPRSSLDDRP